jgi:hypothetical protein
MGFSPLVPVHQSFPSRALKDVHAAVGEALADSRLGAALKPGARVAIAAGSRGIANIALITRAVVDHFRRLGCRPFIFPAMGSHGGGTAAGQLDVLAHYGITEAAMGCPVLSSLEVVDLGRTPDGLPVFMDRMAFESDAVFLVNRVKWHTTFDAPIQSGLVKMAAIGLGKLQGATHYHRYAVRLGLGPVIRSVGRHVLQSGKILGGLAILEDAHHATAKVVALPAAEIEAGEEKLLAEALSWMPRILFDSVDILIVDEVGKHISGVGMDSKVVNRHPYGGVNPWSWAPRILRIYVRDLAPLSYGNAVGIGMADMISERLFSKIDWHATRVNALAASNTAACRVPLRAQSDREALDTLATLVGRDSLADVTCVWIHNTLELSRFLATENLLQADLPAGVARAGDARPWPFDQTGNLDPSFFESPQLHPAAQPV